MSRDEPTYASRGHYCDALMGAQQPVLRRYRSKHLSYLVPSLSVLSHFVPKRPYSREIQHHLPSSTSIGTGHRATTEQASPCETALTYHLYGTGTHPRVLVQAHHHHLQVAHCELPNLA